MPTDEAVVWRMDVIGRTKIVHYRRCCFLANLNVLQYVMFLKYDYFLWGKVTPNIISIKSFHKIAEKIVTVYGLMCLLLFILVTDILFKTCLLFLQLTFSSYQKLIKMKLHHFLFSLFSQPITCPLLLFLSNRLPLFDY